MVQMNATFFPSQFDFRKWLEQNHENETELIVGFYKVDSGKPSMTWSQSVDQALCFGWIDGVRKSIDNESYCIRFTPRRKSSNWSAVNIKKVHDLINLGLMQPAGLEIYSQSNKSKSNNYSFESAPKILSETYESKFRENQIAWDFFTSQAPSYQKTIIHWIMNAKQEKTQVLRLEKTIRQSEEQKRVI